MVGYVSTEMKSPSVKQIAELHCTREGIATGEISEEVRYFITSLLPEKSPADQILELIRSHWSIENSLHHVLDRSWNEDNQHTSSRTQAMNLKQLRQMALNMLRLLFGEISDQSMPAKALTFLYKLNHFIA